MYPTFGAEFVLYGYSCCKSPGLERKKMKRNFIIVGAILGLFFMGHTGIIQAAPITWNSQWARVTATTQYGDGSANLQDGTVTIDGYGYESVGNSTSSIPDGTTNQISSSISNPGTVALPYAPWHHPAGSMSASASSQITGTADGFILETNAVAHNALSYGEVDSDPSRARASAGVTFEGEFTADNDLIIIDLSLAYSLFARSMEPDINPDERWPNAEHNYSIAISLYKSISECEGEECEEEGTILLDEEYFREIYLNAIDEVAEDNIWTWSETFDVESGESYSFYVSLSELAMVYNQGDAGTTSAELTVNVSSVPIPGGIWLLGSGILGLAGFRKRFSGA